MVCRLLPRFFLRSAKPLLDYPPDLTTKIEDWIIDSVERYRMGDVKEAKTSLSFARMGLLKLPPGGSYPALEELLYAVGVKLSHKQVQTNDETRSGE